MFSAPVKTFSPDNTCLSTSEDRTQHTIEKQSAFSSRQTPPKEQSMSLPGIPHFPNAVSHVKDDEGGKTQSTD